MPTKIVISGATGRMGQTLVGLITNNREFELIGGIDMDRKVGGDAARYGFRTIESAESAGELVQAADVLLDFSAVAGLQSLLESRSSDLAGKGLVIGTTGLTPDVLRLLAHVSITSAVIVSANFSVGVNLVLGLVDAAARVLEPEKYDVEIVEAHHRLKVDAPSGTAIALGHAIANGRNVALETLRKDGRSGQTGQRPTGEVGFHSLRGGDIVGDHRVHFIGSRERIEIAHMAQDRTIFAEGALVASKWVKNQPAGSYSMKEVLGLAFLEPGI
ncbi:MAG TPA: 4-hydroxy-tetrahydrodipicolinate reductase [Longimicrobiales bacterium]|nr:4-hydroxy-tetrahydrodipicolinate reductase [Longimicrobiales bacterium]